MNRSRIVHGAGRACMAMLLTACFVSLGMGETCDPANVPLSSMQQLQGLSYDQLMAMFLKADIGNPLRGPAKGKVLVLTDRHLPRIKAKVFNTFWHGKSAQDDGYLVNRWVGGHQWLDTTHTIGNSWVDNKPAMVVEYAPGTPLFANFRDEIREIAHGLYLAILYERCPCPRIKGILGLQLITKPCK